MTSGKMILHRLLEHDMHHSRQSDVNPLIIETPAKTEFLPAVVSTSDWGRFLISRRLTKENRLRSAVFKNDSDRSDELLKPLIAAALKLSIEEKYENIFQDYAAAFNFIYKSSGTGFHPHILLIPKKWRSGKFNKLVPKDDVTEGDSVFPLYKKICKVIPAPVDIPVFFSRPDFVGMYTQFLGNKGSLILHNVRKGMAFVTSK